MSYFALRHVAKSFGSRNVLSGIDLEIQEGEFVSIVGNSASGKTTLLNIAAGLRPACSGTVLWKGEPVTDFPRDAAIVFQNYSLLPWFSALENVMLAVEAAFPTWPARKQNEHARKYLELVGLQQATGKRPGQLSGGMRQRLAVARAFAVEPRILFLDEPFGALDALTRATLQQELASLCVAVGRRVTALMITNNVDEALLLSDRVFALSKGTLSPAFYVRNPRPRAATAHRCDETVLAAKAELNEYLAGRPAREVVHA